MHTRITVSLLTMAAITAGIAVVAVGQQAAPLAAKEQAFLRALEGSWDATVSMQMEPGTPATLSTGIEKITATCGGLWLMSEFKSELKGQSFEGRGMIGYDSNKKKIVTAWVDSMQSWISTTEGTLDASGKKLTSLSEQPDPQTGKPKLMKMLEEHIDADTRRYSMSTAGPDGKDTIIMTITYKRRP